MASLMRWTVTASNVMVRSQTAERFIAAEISQAQVLTVAQMVLVIHPPPLVTAPQVGMAEAEAAVVVVVAAVAIKR